MAERFSMKGSLLAFPLDDQYEIIEVDAPKVFHGQKLANINLPDYGIMTLVTILRTEEKTNFLGKTTVAKKAFGLVNNETVIRPGDVLVLFGKFDDLQDLCNGK